MSKENAVASVVERRMTKSIVYVQLITSIWNAPISIISWN